MSPANILIIAAFMATIANRLVAGLVTPVFEKFGLDKFWLTYISWLVGGLLVWATGVNLFASYIPDPLTGQILSAVIAGGGANLLHDLFDTESDGSLGYVDIDDEPADNEAR